MVWSVDEKTGMQATSRINPTRPAVPGIPARREFEYRRHGTAVLFAGLDVHDGGVAGWVTDSTRSENFVAFLADLVAQTPDRSGSALHRRQPQDPQHRARRDLPRQASARASALHADPRLVAQPGRAVLLDPRSVACCARGEFDSVDDLADRIIAFIKDYNRRAAPFRWTYDGRPLKVA